jgi:hypothetical protein
MTGYRRVALSGGHSTKSGLDHNVQPNELREVVMGPLVVWTKRFRIIFAASGVSVLRLLISGSYVCRVFHKPNVMIQYLPNFTMFWVRKNPIFSPIFWAKKLVHGLEGPSRVNTCENLPNRWHGLAVRYNCACFDSVFVFETDPPSPKNDILNYFEMLCRTQKNNHNILQGCQIFLNAWFPNWKKCTKRTQNVPNGNKIFQLSIKYS